MLACCLVHNRRNLVVAELQVLESVSGACDSATSHDFDCVGALAQLVTTGVAALIHTIDHTPNSSGTGTAAAFAAAVGESCTLADAAKITVPARLGQRAPSEKQARAHPPKHALGSSLCHASISSASVSQRSETASD
jgi:hypothetical protein